MTTQDDIDLIDSIIREHEGLQKDALDAIMALTHFANPHRPDYRVPAQAVDVVEE